MSLTNDNTAAALLRFRAEARLSRAELARRLPVAYRTLEDWEAGIAKPPKYLYRALRDLERELHCERLNTSVVTNS